ncbi:MAG: hypothetical protein KDJ86_01510 [Bauldia sp.]|uniref:hypothetical protein n=1 Tax=Bauldia sp. TaxID=2575872 RepID=UPI001DCE686E|nr:hypothetical protein [Bauldia sp.]MCB1494435.1 hypothetical protein [Bauldia sp.]
MALAVGAGIAGSAAVSIAAAQERDVDFSVADEMPNGWEVSITPYGWMAGISGDLGVAGRTLQINANFYDLLTKSDYLIPVMGYTELRKDRFAIFADGFYTQMKFSKSNMITKNPFAKANLTLKSKAAVTQTLAFAEGGASYEVARWQGPMGDTGLEVLGGARYWYSSIDTSLKINGTVKFGNLGLKKKGKYAVAKSGDIDWVDPVIGARISQEFANMQKFELLGDIGGFGVGSEFSWQVYAGYTKGYQVGQAILAWTLGYRALAANYEAKSGNSLDFVLHGPIAGFTVRW